MRTPFRAQHRIWRIVSWLFVLGILIQLSHAFFYYPIIITSPDQAPEDGQTYHHIYTSRYETPAPLEFPFAYYPAIGFACNDTNAMCQVPLPTFLPRHFFMVPFLLDLAICFGIAIVLSAMTHRPKNKQQPTLNP